MTGEEIIRKTQERLAKASADGLSRRVRCPVYQALTRDIKRHEELHGEKS